MYLVIGDVLNQNEVKDACVVLDAAQFVDGRATAGWHARAVKNNLQAGRGDNGVDTLRATLAKRIEANALFRMFARPSRLTPLILSRYEPGMAYGSHVDDAMIGGIRTDISFTLFLDDPETYDGGALIIETTAGEEEVKLAPGQLVAYPSTTLHRVDPVTRGTRRVAVGWARSQVRHAEQREILFDLDTTVEELRHADVPRQTLDRVMKTRSNLLRRWIES
ncbi:Fe2+-dependent dioxygenase [Aurantimonas sp. A3-2-R12]|uniref:Fe2+-dependent dioxygenase n=1 Tax=Aurantimonas sp. A3-2-R12 TaxID=3114362 RepID=UPI002E17B0CB|nr:Fe2+-dependent dioxygenase [Aurantimonas sp. A3-2-R12]